VTFGSIDDVSAPISSSPASAPQVKSEGVKSFGSLHVNEEGSLSSRSAAGPSSSIPALSIPTATPSKPKVDIRRFFQHSSSQPPTPSTSNDASSPARPSPLPSHASSNQSTQSPLTPSSYPFFTHYPCPQQQQDTSPSNGPPRSPTYTPNPNVLLLRYGERTPVAVIKGESLSVRVNSSFFSTMMVLILNTNRASKRLPGSVSIVQPRRNSDFMQKLMIMMSLWRLMQQCGRTCGNPSLVYGLRKREKHLGPFATVLSPRRHRNLLSVFSLSLGQVGP